MAVDALLQLQPLVTKTATFVGAPVFLPAGTPRRGLNARVIYSAAANASGSNTVTFSINVAKDGGTNYYPEFQSDPITLTTTAGTGEIAIPFTLSPTSVANGDYVEAVVTFAGAGTGATITYQVDTMLGRP